MRSLLAAMASVAIAFTVVLGLGFWIQDRSKSIPDGVFGAAAAVSISAIAFLLTCWMLKISPWSGWMRRMQRFGSRPVDVRPSAEDERWAAARVAYAENPVTTASCPHLQPIEKAMRRAGLDVGLHSISEFGPVIKASCRIHEPELRRAFHLPASVYYREGYEPERSECDNPRADIVCADCLKTDRARCDILVLHPDQWRADTPWFPTSPTPAEADATS